MENLINKLTQHDDKPPIRVLITEATSFVARSLAYQIFSNNIFGGNQEIILSLYDSSESNIFLGATEIEITASAPNLLKGN